MPLAVGDYAPGFILSDQFGHPHRLEDCRGFWVFLYFCPTSRSMACRAEACAIRDAFPQFPRVNAKLFWISGDPVARHREAVDALQLNFNLLSDEDHEVAEVYGAVTKTHLGGLVGGNISAKTFVIDPEGRIAKIYERFDPVKHAEQVIADLGEFQKQCAVKAAPARETDGPALTPEQ
jgi:peroxiredoxin Q/BCP